jgi:hypothetical protein
MISKILSLCSSHFYHQGVAAPTGDPVRAKKYGKIRMVCQGASLGLISSFQLINCKKNLDFIIFPFYHFQKYRYQQQKDEKY